MKSKLKIVRNKWVRARMSGKIVVCDVNLVLHNLKPRIQRYNSAYAVKNIEFSAVPFVSCNISFIIISLFYVKLSNNSCSLHNIVYLFPLIHSDVKYKRLPILLFSL
jgi:hypothetical protein